MKTFCGIGVVLLGAAVFLSGGLASASRAWGQNAGGSGYPIPYVLPTQESISEVLHRVLGYLETAMPTRVLDRAGGTEITDFSTPARTAVLDRGDNNAFSPLDYTTGVVHSGMLLAWEVTGDEKFKQFTERHMQFIHDRIPYFQAMGGQRNAFTPVFEPDSLDACGSMCAALIKARRANVGPDLKDVIDRWADYVHTKQFRLADGNLARHRPQTESIWADDMYMGIPALAQMGKLTGDRAYTEDAVKQLLGFDHHLFNPQTGLYMHGQNLNQPENPEFYWGRANGWAVLATCELLDCLPEDHPQRGEILKIFRAHLKALVPLQSNRGLWHQMLDKPDSYLETSCTAMFVYGMAHAINKGWISPVSYGDVAQAGWNGLTTVVNAKGQVDGTCVGTTFASDNAYYYARPANVTASHGYGPVLLAGAEMMRLMKNPGIEIRYQNNTYNYVPKN